MSTVYVCTECEKVYGSKGKCNQCKGSLTSAQKTATGYGVLSKLMWLFAFGGIISTILMMIIFRPGPGDIWIVYVLISVAINILIWGLLSKYFRKLNIEKSNERAIEKAKLKEVTRRPKRNCVKCGREIPFDAVVCPYCAHKF